MKEVSNIFMFYMPSISDFKKKIYGAGMTIYELEHDGEIIKDICSKEDDLLGFVEFIDHRFGADGWDEGIPMFKEYNRLVKRSDIRDDVITETEETKPIYFTNFENAHISKTIILKGVSSKLLKEIQEIKTRTENILPTIDKHLETIRENNPEYLV